MECQSKMKKIAIIAPTGMLGSMVYNILKNKYLLTLYYRNKENLELLDRHYGGVKKHKAIKTDFAQLYEEFVVGNQTKVPTRQNNIFKSEFDIVINCAGITKPHSLSDPRITFFVNSALPHLLSTFYEDKLIQITTDCVFSGITGAPYDENARFSPLDLYGLSKSLGEPSTKSLILRTSIIGPEIKDFTLLVSWVMKQKKQADGFISHLWNGITTKQFAKICEEIIDNREVYPKNGIYHIFSNEISKYELVKLLALKYNPNCEILPIRVKKIDRRLTTIHKVNSKLKIPTIQQQIGEL